MRNFCLLMSRVSLQRILLAILVNVNMNQSINIFIFLQMLLPTSKILRMFLHLNSFLGGIITSIIVDSNLTLETNNIQSVRITGNLQSLILRDLIARTPLAPKIKTRVSQFRAEMFRNPPCQTMSMMIVSLLVMSIRFWM